MAKTLTVIVQDDLDGSDGAETVTFGFDGVAYEIDLSKVNRAKLESAVGPYMEAGRRVSPGRRTSATRRTQQPRFDRAAVRTWARENGLKVSERGRISTELLEKYNAAH
jgi:hypothetical protein